MAVVFMVGWWSWHALLISLFGIEFFMLTFTLLLPPFRRYVDDKEANLLQIRVDASEIDRAQAMAEFRLLELEDMEDWQRRLDEWRQTD